MRFYAAMNPHFPSILNLEKAVLPVLEGQQGMDLAKLDGMQSIKFLWVFPQNL